MPELLIGASCRKGWKQISAEWFPPPPFTPPVYPVRRSMAWTEVMQYLVGDFKVEQSSSTLDAEPISVMHPELPTIPEWQYFFLPDLFSCPAKSVPLYQNLTLDSLTCYVVGRVCSRQQTDNVLVPSKLTSQIRSFCRSLVSRVIVLLSPLLSPPPFQILFWNLNQIWSDVICRVIYLYHV